MEEHHDVLVIGYMGHKGWWTTSNEHFGDAAYGAKLDDTCNPVWSANL